MLALLKRLLRGDSGAPPSPVRAPVPETRPADPAVEASLRAAVEALNGGRRGEAIDRLRHAADAHPEAAGVHFMLGRLLYEDGEHDEARDCYLLACAHRPGWPEPHHLLGMLAFERGDWNGAALSLRQAAALGASGAQVHNALGAALLHLNDVTAAEACFRAALEVDPDFGVAHSNLGYILCKHLERYEEGERHIRRALELEPDDSGVLCNLVMVLQQRGDFDQALALAARLLADDPSRAEVRYNRGLILLARGDFSAWPDYEARRALPEARRSADLPWPDWDGSNLAGKTVYVYREQGIGDEIMFASCLPEVISQARHCFIECAPKLAPIFRRSFPSATVLLRNEWREGGGDRAGADCKSAIGTLARYLRRKASDFPAHAGYLSADARRVAHWKARLAALPGRCKVGISWRGGLPTTQRGRRSIPLSAWQPILSSPGIDFVSLQYGDVDDELAALRANGASLTHWQEAIDDYDETAALVSALDLVISVQTAIVHLAGALGRRAWVLISARPEWRYGTNGTSMVWYPAVTLYRQAVLGEWAPAIEAVRLDLARLCSGDVT